MSPKVITLMALFLPFLAVGQHYEDAILQYREGYKMSLMKGDHALKPSDTGYLRFYPPNPDYRVKAAFEQITGTAPFKMNTMHGGTGPGVRVYGKVYFNMNGAKVTLYVYRMVSPPTFRVLARNLDNADNNIILFIPFTDRTNYKETFAGGRYMDVSAASLLSGDVIIDFNKACNPHTAYEKGYPYIVMPLEATQSSPLEWEETRRQPNDPQVNTVPVNEIPFDIKAGEKIYGHHPGY